MAKDHLINNTKTLKARFNHRLLGKPLDFNPSLEIKFKLARIRA
jgi:hypothetical protein